MCETTALLERRPGAMADLLAFVVSCRHVECEAKLITEDLASLERAMEAKEEDGAPSRFQRDG